MVLKCLKCLAQIMSHHKFLKKLTDKQEFVYRWLKAAYFSSSMMTTDVFLHNSKLSSQRLSRNFKEAQVAERE